MGLAAPRKRAKLSHDPNNTKWTRDTGGFGHKLMVSQGWKPGEYLGAKDAAHVEFHTTASASHIRVIIKDDNLGLGAKRGSGQAAGECTGLDAFQNLLGRLNGKDEDELAKEQESREDLRRAIYTEQRWGRIRFVEGGYLVGDKILKLAENEAGRILKLSGGLTGMATPSVKESSSDCSELQATTESSVTKSKKSKRYKGGRVESSQVTYSEILSKTARASNNGDLTPTKQKDDTSQTLRTKLDQRKKRKIEKPTEETRGYPTKSKKRRKGKEDLAVIATNVGNLTKELKRSKVNNTSLHHKAPSQEQTGISLFSPVTTEPTVPQPPPSGSRHAVRSRFIAQKRLAVLDPTSLNEIFMIKK